ncbi:cache domain-containing protein [bacterium]|nr:cache domain-containing protein [bacterium]
MSLKKQGTITIRWKLFLWFGSIVAVLLLVSSLFNYTELATDIEDMAQRELRCYTDTILQTTILSFENAVQAYLKAQSDHGRSVCDMYDRQVERGSLVSAEARQQAINYLNSEQNDFIKNGGFLCLLSGAGEIRSTPQPIEPGLLRMIASTKKGYVQYKPEQSDLAHQIVAWLTYYQPWDSIMCAVIPKRQLQYLTGHAFFKPYLKSVVLGESGYPYIINTRGDVLVHPELEDANLFHQKDAAGKEFIKEMIEKKNGRITYLWKKPGTNQIVKKIVMFRYNPDLDWMIASGIYEDELYSPLHHQRKLYFVYVFVALVVILITAFFFSASFTNPITQIIGLLEGAKRGDLTKRLTILKSDELGKIMLMINEFLDTLHLVTSDIHKNAEKLNNSTSELTAISQEIFSTANQQAAAVAEVVATVEEFATMSRQMAKNASGVAQVAVETEKDVERGAGNVNATLERMKTIKISNEENITELNKLRKRVEQINEVLKFINNIADQTKLIAFNAALEASSSEGNSGKRFGIVAIEIRRLAEGIVEQTRDIEETINEITQATQELALSFEQSSNRVMEGYTQAAETSEVLETILSGAKQTRKSARQIDSGTSQQQIALDQIVNTLKEISETVQHFVGATKHSDEITQKINEISEEFKKTVSHFRLMNS